jgi:TetR/AcrR family transcriptional repressor of mexCD-oprJ operon
MQASPLRRHRRADALRNEASVLDAAARVLTENASATIPDIAAASGVARATIYRHFPTRDALLGALMERALAEVGDAFASARVEEGSAREAFARLVAGLVALGDRYRFLLTESRRPDYSKDHATEQMFRSQLIALIERGQRSGEFRLDVPASWANAVVGPVIEAGVVENALRGYGPKETVRLVVSTLMDGLVAAPR